MMAISFLALFSYLQLAASIAIPFIPSRDLDRRGTKSRDLAVSPHHTHLSKIKESEAIRISRAAIDKYYCTTNAAHAVCGRSQIQ